MPLSTDKIVPWPAVLPYDKQAVPVPGTKRPGQTGTSRASDFVVILVNKVSLAHYRNCLWLFRVVKPELTSL